MQDGMPDYQSLAIATMRPLHKIIITAAREDRIE